MSVEAYATELLEHGEVGYPEVRELSNRLLEQVPGPLRLGLYVRVQTGISSLTRQFPETTKALTTFLAQEFPGDPFLAIQIQLNREVPPHKDVRNAPLPTLLVNLSEGHPGGTWMQDPMGTVLKTCADGVARLGRVVTGRRYRISARQLWHSSVGSTQDRLLLLGYVPAGWNNASAEDKQALRCLNFCLPRDLADARSTMTIWRGDAITVQKSLEDFGVRRVSRSRGSQWEEGKLRWVPGELHICLSSDESGQEDDDVIVCITLSVP